MRAARRLRSRFRRPVRLLRQAGSPIALSLCSIRIGARQNDCEECGGRQNRNSPEGVENQQILVARHQTIRTTSDGDFQQLVVVRIAADRHCARQFHLHGAEAQVGNERPASRIIHVLAEFRSREPLFQFVEQLPGNDQGRIV
jgi:hypothetical protein